MLLSDYKPEKEISDEDLLKRSLENPSLFSLIVDRYQEAFQRKAMLILRSPDEARDAVQDTFTRIYFNGSRFTPQEGATFKSWAYKILINTTFSRYQKLKKERKMRADLEPEILELFPDSGEVALRENKVLSDLVVSVFSRMPRELVRVLDLHFLKGYPHKDIAGEEGVTEGAIKTRIFRAKKIFRKLLSS